MRKLFVALAFVACGGVAFAATPHVDDFSVDEMGWSGGASAEWQANGGPMGTGDGYLQLTSFNHLATNNTESSWIGDYAAINAETVFVDMKNEIGSPPLHMRVVLFGLDAILQSADRWTSSIAAVVPADGVWRSYSFSLAESDLTHVVNQNDANYEDMFADVVQVMLRHDVNPPSSGGDSVIATLGIDNVRLAAAPLPGDYNRNGEVDLNDYHTWRGSFGTTDSAADGNMSGLVDAADYVFWRDRLAPQVVEVQAVPELATLPLAGLALIGAMLLKRKRGTCNFFE